MATMMGTEEEEAEDVARVAECMEQLMAAAAPVLLQQHDSYSPPHNLFQSTETILCTLCDLLSTSVTARNAVRRHPQSIPLLASVLRSEAPLTVTAMAKASAAELLDMVCSSRVDEEEDPFEDAAESMKMRVVLGGCVAPLLALIELDLGGDHDSLVAQSQIAAAKAMYTISMCADGHGDGDRVALKIFVAEGADLRLWQKLKLSCSRGAAAKPRQQKIDELVSGILRNLRKQQAQESSCIFNDAERIHVLLRLIESGSPDAQCHCCHLLAEMMTSPDEQLTCSISAIITSVVAAFLKLLSDHCHRNLPNLRTRAAAAKALMALTKMNRESRQLIIEYGGIPALISAAAPTVITTAMEASKQATAMAMAIAEAQALQKHAIGALANIYGSLASVIEDMAEKLIFVVDGSRRSSTRHPVIDITAADDNTLIGALAAAFLIFDDEPAETRIDRVKIEKVFLSRIKSNDGTMRARDSSMAMEALANLYGNRHLALGIANVEVKRKLVLAAMVMADCSTSGAHQQQQQAAELIDWLANLINSCSDADLWQVIHQRHGVQVLVSLLATSTCTEEQKLQEISISLLATIAAEMSESRWAIIAAGGLPPLVHILQLELEPGYGAGSISMKAKEEAASILANLCQHCEDIRACVEKAGAMSSLLWLLKNAQSHSQQEAACQALRSLVTLNPQPPAPAADLEASPISILIKQLHAMLTENASASAAIADSLAHCLSVSSLHDLLWSADSAANASLRSLIHMLDQHCHNQQQAEAQQQIAASILATVFSNKKDDLCRHGSNVASDLIAPLQRMLVARNDQTAMSAARCLAAILHCIPKGNHKVFEAVDIQESLLRPLLKLCESSDVQVLEQAVSALANLFKLLQDEQSPWPQQDAASDLLLQPLTRVLRDGTREGKRQATRALSQILLPGNRKDTMDSSEQQSSEQCDTAILAVMEHLAAEMQDGEAAIQEEALEAMAFLVRMRRSHHSTIKTTEECDEEATASMPLLLNCLAMGRTPTIKDRAASILSVLCEEQPAILGDEIGMWNAAISSLADRITSSPCPHVQISATSLLTCAAREHHNHTMKVLLEAGSMLPLIHSLVKMLLLAMGSHASSVPSSHVLHQLHDFNLNKTAPLQLLCEIASHDHETKLAIAKAGAIEAIIRQLECNHESEEQDSTAWRWICGLLLAVLVQDKTVVLSSSRAIHLTIPLLVESLLKPDAPAVERYFACQAITNLVLGDDHGTVLAIANSGAPVGLISLLGSSELDTPHFLDIAHEFMLVPNPAQTALEHLFGIGEIRTGSPARKAIPLLVELLKPSSDRPNAPLLAEGLLAMLATGNNENKLLMAEAGVLEALTKYLSLGPQQDMEECTADLFRILFSSSELRRHRAAMGALEQLVALLRLGGKSARYSASRALQELFVADHIKNSDIAKQAIPSLMEMLRAGSEKEQRIALRALSTLSIDNQPKAMIVADPRSKCLDLLRKTLNSDHSLDLKEEVAGLCFALFSFPSIRSNPAAAGCIEPLVVLARDQTARSTWSTVLHALNNSFDTASLADIAVKNGIISTLLAVLMDEDDGLHEIVIMSLLKLGKANEHYLTTLIDRNALERLFHLLPSFTDLESQSAAAELLQILTTNSSSLTSQIPPQSTVEPLVSLLSRPLTVAGQYSAMQILLNFMKHANQILIPNQAIHQLISLLDSPSLSIQKLAPELFFHLLMKRQLEKSMITKKVIASLIQLAGTGMQRAIFALETASGVSPETVAEAGGIPVVASVITQLDPLPPHELWESATSVVRSILQSNKVHYRKIPVETFVRMLQSDNESTILVALQAMLTLQRENAEYRETLVRTGVLHALLELVKCHKCERESAQLLETLLNDEKVRNSKTAYTVIAPLANYLLDKKTKNPAAQLLSALALGDMFQQHTSASPSDAVLACQALISLLKHRPSNDIRTVALSALQNILTNGQVNKQALVEVGAVDIIHELIRSNNTKTAGQAATLAKLLFSTPATLAHPSTEIVNALSVALEKNLAHDSSIEVRDVIAALAALFTNSPKLCATESANNCIPLLIKVLGKGTAPVQDATLEILCQLQQAWTTTTKEIISKEQALAMTSAIPVLQGLIKSGPSKFHDRANALLMHLPGNLVVTIKQGKNLRQKIGSTSAFCKISLGSGNIKETKVVSDNICPEWNESLSWHFDKAPKGQRIQITCMNKSTFGKVTLGKVTVQIDRVIAFGTITGNFTLQPVKNRDGTPRILEIEISWSSR